MTLEHFDNNTNVLNEDDIQQPSLEMSERGSEQSQEHCSVNTSSYAASTQNSEFKT